MTEKKLTDNEVIKYLKDKIEFENFDENGYAVVDIEKLKNTLDLINRLKVELFEKTEQLETAKEENENFKMVLEAVEDHIHPLPFETDFDKAIKQAKAEAYKNFAERLKRTFPKDDFLRSTKRISEDIDNLLKELVGDK